MCTSVPEETNAVIHVRLIEALVTSAEIRLESLLPRSSSGPDFIITVDGGGYNAGIWLLRRSQWSQDFLQRWWDMKAYVRV